MIREKIDLQTLIFILGASTLCSLTTCALFHWINLFFFPRKWKEMLDKNLPRHKQLLYGMGRAHNLDVEKVVMKDDFSKDCFVEDCDKKITIQPVKQKQHFLDLFVDRRLNVLRQLSIMIDAMPTELSAQQKKVEQEEGSKLSLLLENNMLVYGAHAKHVYKKIFEFESVISPLMPLVIKPLILDQQFKPFLLKFDPQKVALDFSSVSDEQKQDLSHVSF